MHTKANVFMKLLISLTRKNFAIIIIHEINNQHSDSKYVCDRLNAIKFECRAPETSLGNNKYKCELTNKV